MRAVIRTLALVLAIGVWSPIASAAPAHVGISAVTASAAGFCSPTYTPTIGNSLAVIVWETANFVRTYAVSNGGDSFVSVVSTTGTNNATIEVFRSFLVTSAGSIVVAQFGGGAQAFSCQVIEFTEADSVSAFDTADNAAAADHYGGATGISVPVDAYVVAAGTFAAAVTAFTAGATNNAVAYTKTTGASNMVFAQYAAIGAPETAERGHWTQTGTNRASSAVIIAFAVGAAPTPGGQSLLLLGLE